MNTHNPPRGTALRHRADKLERILQQQPLTTTQLLERVGVGRNAVCKALRYLHEQHRICIVRYEPPPSIKGQWIAVYAAGNAPDAEPPARRTGHDRYLRYYEYRAWYRAQPENRARNIVYQREYHASFTSVERIKRAARLEKLKEAA